jgi:hypothetical protein
LIDRANRKICILCAQSLPITTFDLVPETRRRDAACRECREHLAVAARAQDSARQLKKQLKDRTIAAKTLLASLRENHIDVPHISEIAGIMSRQFGGTEEFVCAWFRQLQIAIQERPGSRIVLSAFRDIKDLYVESTKHRATAPDMHGMTDDELENIALGLVQQAKQMNLLDDMTVFDSPVQEQKTELAAK